MQESEFRYYRWRTLYGGRLWAFDAPFYILLGHLHLLDQVAAFEQRARAL